MSTTIEGSPYSRALLSCINELFKVLIWKRIKGWWSEEGVISLLQGACRQGSSYLHSALILQEGIAAALDANKNVFVAYFDTFNSVWIDGLFHQLRNMGVVGKTWRLLYKSYHDLRCKVRLAGCYADWYQMRCGIHQGGFLSLPSGHSNIHGTFQECLGEHSKMILS